MKRRITQSIYVGNVEVGGNSKITVQSMTKTDTRDVESTIYEIKLLEEAGCEIVRCAVPDIEAAKALKEIKKIAKKNKAEVNLKYSEDGISPGQACVFYNKDKFGFKVLGGGWIKD